MKYAKPRFSKYTAYKNPVNAFLFGSLRMKYNLYLKDYKSLFELNRLESTHTSYTSKATMLYPENIDVLMNSIIFSNNDINAAEVLNYLLLEDLKTGKYDSDTYNQINMLSLKLISFLNRLKGAV